MKYNLREIYKRLKTCSAEMENGDQAISAAVRKLAHAADLYREFSRLMAHKKGKVRIVKADPAGSYSIHDFDEES